MSTTVESRVVEMRFDNSQFERNVSSTMSTLDKLKAKLNFSGSAKGLNDVNAAAKNINMNGLARGIETVSARFSALDVIGVTALANITNSAVNAGKRIISALTIDPIKTGFQEYETQINAVQTILANTSSKGTTIDDVNAALQQLNEYADKTIYNFTEMTRNIGTFTAAGVDLDTSVSAIQGIANLAAVSGSTSQQASTAMYQLSQALSTGTVRLQDWNSVVNAGMGGEVFQNALVRTAAVMAGASENVEAWRQENIESFGSFRDSLTQGGWLTTDVLTETLNQFTMAAEEGSEEWEKYKKSLMETGYTEKQAEEILKMANTATDAATKVKTFTQLWDVLKESAQSGWSQTWKLLIGDFEQAKGILTPLADFFTNIIGKISDFRNNILEGALGMGFKKIGETVEAVSAPVEKAAETIDDLGKIVDEVILGKFGNGAERFDKLTKMGLNYCEVQNKVNEKLGDSTRYTQEEIDAQNKLLGISSETQKSKRKSINLQKKYTEKQLKELSYTKEQIAAYNELTEAATKLGMPLEEFVEKMDEIDGRWLMIESFKNIGKGLVDTFNAIKMAWQDVFPPKSIEERSQALFNMIAVVYKFSRSIASAIYDGEKFTEIGDKIYRTFKGVFAIFDIVATIIGGGFKMAFKVVNGLLGKFGLCLLDITAFVGDAVVAFRDWFEETLGVSKIVDTLAPAIEALSKFISDLIYSVKNSHWLGLLSDFIGGIAEGLGRIVSWITEILGAGASLITTLTLTAVIKTINGVVTALKAVFDVVKKWTSAFGRTDLGKWFSSVFDKWPDTMAEVSKSFVGGIDSVEKWISKIKETEFFKTAAGWIEDASKRISDAVEGISDKIANFSTSSLVTGLTTFGSFVSGIAGKLSNSETFITIVDGVIAAFDRIKEFFKNFKLPKLNLDSLKIFSGWMDKGQRGAKGGLLGSIAGFAEGVKGTAITKLKGYFKNIFSIDWETFKTNALANFANFWIKSGEKIKAAFEQVEGFLKSVITFLFGAEKINLPVILDVVEKFLMIGVLLKTLGVLQTLMAPLDNVTDALQNHAKKEKWEAIGNAFKAMALALGAFTICLVVLAGMMDDSNKALKAAGVLVGLMVVMGVLVGVLGKFTDKLDEKINIAAAASAILMVSVSLLLLVQVIKQIDTLDIKHPIQTPMVFLMSILGLISAIKVVAKAGGANFASIAAIITMLTALKMIPDIITAYDEYDWKGKTDAIWHMVDMLMVLSLAVNVATRGIGAGASAKGTATLILAMVVSLKIILGVMEDFAAMPTEDIIKGGIVVTALLTAMTLMMYALGKLNEAKVLQKGESLKTANNFAGVAAALLAMVAAVWLLGKMDTDTLVQGGVALTAGLLLLTGMLYALGKSCSGLKTGVILTVMIMFGVLLAEIAIIIKVLDSIPWQNMLASAGALTGVLLAMTKALRSVKMDGVSASDIVKWVGAMLVMLGALFLLAKVLTAMDSLDPINSIASAAALSLLLISMSGVLKLMSKTKPDVADLATWIGAMAGLVLLMYGIAPVLKELNGIDAGNAIGNAIALGVLLNAMASAMLILSNSKSFSAGQMGTILASMVTLSIILYALAEVISTMEGVNPANAVGNAIALGVLLNAMASAMLILSNSKSFSAGQMGTILGSVLVLSLVLYALSDVMHLMEDVSSGNAIGNAIALGVLLNAMASAMLILSYTKQVSASAIAGMVVMSLVVGMLSIVLAETKAMKCESAISTAISLSILLIAMSAVYAILGATGGLAAAAISGAIGLVAVVGILGAVAIAIGALMSVIPAETISKWKTGFEDFMDFLAILSKGLGEVIGGFVSGLTTELPTIGQNIRDFANAIGEIDETSITGIESLCKAIETMVSANLKDSFTQLLPGDNSLSSFGSQIEAFAECIRTTSETISGISDTDAENIKRVAAAGTAMADLAEAIPSKGGLLQDIVGEKDLEDFGKSAVAFAKCMVAYSKEVTGQGIDAEAITASASAAQSLSDLTNSLPKTGGVWQDVAGEQDLIAFGASIVAFADCLVKYSNKIAEGNIDSDAITNSATAAEALATLEGKLPAQNGWWQTIAGEQDIGEFGTKLITFANGLVAYANAAAQIDDTKIDAIKNSGTAIDELVAVMDKIPESGGWGDAIFGSSDGQSFGAALSAMANGIASYCSVAATIDDSDITAIQNSKTAVEELGSVLSAAPETVESQKATALLTATTNLATIASAVNDLSTASYNYSGLDTFKTMVSKLTSMLESVDTAKLRTDFATLYGAVTNASVCAQSLSKISDYSFDGVDEFKTALKSLSGTDLDGVVNAFSGKAEEMVSAVTSFVGALSTGLKNGGATAANAMTALVNDIYSAAKGKADEFKTAGKSFVSELAEGIKSRNVTATAAGKSIASNAVSGVKAKYSSMSSAGGYLGDGLVAGINSKSSAVYWAAYALGAMAVKGEKDGQASNSPSKLTIQAGKWLGEGLIIGIDRMGKAVYNAGADLGASATGSISNSIARIADMVSNDIDAQPTIRPVLDLSDVRTGASAIGNMLGGGYSMDVLANAKSVSASMNRNRVSTTNDDVVFAIDKLRKDLGNVGNTTNNYINGITYDDGNNVSDAIKSIARYAIQERRS